MSQQPFKKFINPKNNAAIKEKHKQDKKNTKKERAAAIEKHFEEKRAMRQKAFSANTSIETDKKDKRQKYPQQKKEQPVAPPSAAKKSSNTPEMPLNKFVAHCIEGNKQSLASAHSEHSNRTIILIGPEGDFTPKEIEEAILRGYVPVSLGQNRLRTETAGIVAASLMII